MIFFLFILAIALLITFLFSTLALATANAWVFQGTFSDGWAMCWDRWYIVLAWSVLFLGIMSIFRD